MKMKVKRIEPGDLESECESGCGSGCESGCRSGELGDEVNAVKSKLRGEAESEVRC
jgi:hypothetical protein